MDGRAVPPAPSSSTTAPRTFSRCRHTQAARKGAQGLIGAG